MNVSHHGITVIAMGLICIGARGDVTVSGGPDVSSHNYTWTITNDRDTPLVYVEIPHFRADVFEVPNGWSGQMNNQNSPDFQPGSCVATAMDESLGLKRGESATFKMRIGPSGAQEGTGDILLRFADGSEVRVLAAVAVKHSKLQHYALPIGLGAIFGVYLLVKALRRPPPRHQAA